MEDNGVRCYDLGDVHYSEVFRNMEMNLSLRPIPLRSIRKNEIREELNISLLALYLCFCSCLPVFKKIKTFDN